MISFVVWKWTDERMERRFMSAHVNVLARQINKYYPDRHRVVCVTDDPIGLSPGIVAVPIPRTGFEDLVNPNDYHPRPPRQVAMKRRGYFIQHTTPSQSRQKKLYPSCYRRLWNFSREARAVLGERIFALDIDVIVMDDLRPLVDRSADFVGWCDPHFEKGKIAGGVYLLKTGSHPEVWEDFRAQESIDCAVTAGHKGSDQGWMSLKLFPPEQSWSNGDGLMKLNWVKGKRPPEGTRMVFTNGAAPPWDSSVRRAYPWIKEYWN